MCSLQGKHKSLMTRHNENQIGMSVPSLKRHIVRFWCSIMFWLPLLGSLSMSVGTHRQRCYCHNEANGVTVTVAVVDVAPTIPARPDKDRTLHVLVKSRQPPKMSDTPCPVCLSSLHSGKLVLPEVQARPQSVHRPGQFFPVLLV